MFRNARLSAKILLSAMSRVLGVSREHAHKHRHAEDELEIRIEEHGGLFKIKSALGEGTKVTIRFPRDRVIDGPKPLETPENVEKPRLENSR